MLFNSIEYFIFLALVLILYLAFKPRLRWMLLLVASYAFYANWSFNYCFLLLGTTILTYLSALLISKSHEDIRKKKLYLVFCILANVGILFLFKYFNFFNQSLGTLFQWLDLPYGVPDFKLLLPIGISYYIFQAISYIVDVYQGKMEPERHLGIFALYLVFFPKLVAGPIERAHNLIPQLYEAHFSITKAVSGFKLIGWGLFKKVVIADHLAIVVNTVYANPQGYGSVPLITATVFYAFQIYCDFSAYTDMAMGSARVLGFELTQNFQRPYYAKSIKEFWSRWHITLSSWLRDYVYIPLGGNRVKVSRYYLNILLTFLVSGLWHGANWTFVLWGGLHGIYQVASHMTRNVRQKFTSYIGLTKFPRVHKLFKVAITFSLVCFAWIFFRANSIADGIYIATHLFSNVTGFANPSYVINQLLTLGLNKIEYMVVFFSLLILEIVHLYQRNEEWKSRFANWPLPLRWAFYYLIIFMIIILGVYDSETQFIYVQF